MTDDEALVEWRRITATVETIPAMDRIQQWQALRAGRHDRCAQARLRYEPSTFDLLKEIVQWICGTKTPPVQLMGAVEQLRWLADKNDAKTLQRVSAKALQMSRIGRLLVLPPMMQLYRRGDGIDVFKPTEQST